MTIICRAIIVSGETICRNITITPRATARIITGAAVTTIIITAITETVTAVKALT